MKNHLRLRTYYGLFGVIGCLVMLVTYTEIPDFVGDYSGWFEPLAAPLLGAAQLAQTAACVGYVYIAIQYLTLLQQKSPWPRRFVTLSIVAAAATACFRSIILGVPNVMYAVLPLLLNLAYNVSILRLLREGEEKEAEVYSL